MMTMERLKKLESLTDPNEKNVKKARREDYLNQSLMLLSKEAGKPYYGDYGYSTKQWRKLVRLLWELNEKVQNGEKITPWDWKRLGETAEACQGETISKKQSAVVARVLKMCKRATDSNWPSEKEDNALLDIYKREKKGEFYALDYIADKSYYTLPVIILPVMPFVFSRPFTYKDCDLLDSLVRDAKDAKNKLWFDPSNEENKQAYTDKLSDIYQEGERLREGDPKKARRLGGIAEAMGKLEPATNDTPMVKHAKKMFPYAIGLALDLKAARKGLKNSDEYKKFLKATREYGKLMVNLITGRKEVKEEDYNNAFDDLKAAAKAYLKHKFGKTKAEEMVDDLQRLPENLENAQDSKIEKVYKNADERTKQKIKLAIGALKNLTPFQEASASPIKNTNTI